MKKFCLILVLFGIYLFLLGLSSKSSVFAAGTTYLYVSLTNQGNSPTANVDYYIVREDGTEVARRNDIVGANNTVYKTFTDPQGTFTGYTIIWTAQKSEGAAPGDWLCWEPETSFIGGDRNAADDIEWTASVNFTCNLPPSGPSQPSGFSGSCDGSNGFNSWNASSGASYYSIINGTTNPPENGGYSSQSPGGTSVSWGGLSPGVTYYQRVNAVNASGAWSSPSYTSFTCPGAAPPPPPPPPPPPSGHAGSLSRSVPSCAVGLYDASFSWSGSGSGWFFDLTTDSSWSGWEFQDVSGRTSTGWPGLPTNTTIYWRVWDTIDHHYGASFNVPECGGTYPTPGYGTPTYATPYGTPYATPALTDPSIKFHLYNDTNGDGVRQSSEDFTNNFGGAATIRVNNVNRVLSSDGETAYIVFNPSQTVNVVVNTSSGWAARAWETGSGTNRSGTFNFTSPNTYTATPTHTSANGSIGYKYRIGIYQPQPPTVDLKANGQDGPITVASGSSVALTWTTTGSPTTCTGSGAWSGAKAVGGGSQNVVVGANSTYTITCTNSGGTAVDSVTVNVAVVPTNLNVTGLLACATGAAANYNATFNWTGSASNWTIDVDGDGNWGNGWLATKTVVSGTTTTGPAGFTNSLVFQPGQTYYWRIYYNLPGSHVYYTAGAGDSSTGPGDAFTVPWCLDLKAKFVNNAAPTTYQAGEVANLIVRVTNIGGQASSATTVGVWTSSQGGFPSCTGLGVGAGTVPASQSFGVPALALGESRDIPVSFNVGGASGIANAYVIPSCNQNDRFWPNNATNGEYWVGDTREDEDDDDAGNDPTDNLATLPGGFTYVVESDAWFETTGGDVGSHGTITVVAPPSGKYQSTYLVAGKEGLDTDLSSEAGWRIGNYTKRLIPTGGTYNFLKERFRQKATTEACSLGALATGTGPHFCASDVTLSGSVPGGHKVLFVDGSLTVDGNLTVGAADTVTFIVSGNINVDPTVTQMDGIYVAGLAFNSSSSSSALVVDGAVYADAVSLGRVLVPASANDTNPAEQLNFQVKYLVGLNSVLGSPSVSWREVAP